jgi:hypothetical protein
MSLISTGVWHSTNKSYSIKDLNDNCLAEFRTHWQCLDNHNQQLWNCRSEERRLNTCVFDKLVRAVSVFCRSHAHLTVTETGEDNTRHAKGRATRTFADAQYLRLPLSYVHYMFESKLSRKGLKHLLENHACDRY